MSSVLITGGGRGLGLELARQLGQLPESQISTVFITTRGSASSELEMVISESKQRIVNVLCEATEGESVKKAVAEIESYLEGRGLDILINNVGIMPTTPGGTQTMDPGELTKAFDVNVVTTHRMTSACLPILQMGKDKRIIMISTTVGTFALNQRYQAVPTPMYKITKAAMNMLSVQYAQELEKDGFTVLSVSPGWLKTDMGSSYADLEVEVGARATIDIILKADSSQNGKFQNILVPGWEHAEGPNQYDGAEVAW